MNLPADQNDVSTALGLLRDSLFIVTAYESSLVAMWTALVPMWTADAATC